MFEIKVVLERVGRGESRSEVERGRHHNQATCAVATHLADRVYALLRENRPYQPRALDGTLIEATEAKRIAASLAVDPETRKRLRVLNKREEGPRGPGSRQPKAPHDTSRPSNTSLSKTQAPVPSRGVDTA